MASTNSRAETPRARALGAALRDARKNLGLTTRQLADLIGRNNSHITRFEQGQLIPSEADLGAVLQLSASTEANESTFWASSETRSIRTG